MKLWHLDKIGCPIPCGAIVRAETEAEARAEARRNDGYQASSDDPNVYSCEPVDVAGPVMVIFTY